MQTTLYRRVPQHAARFIAHTEASTGAELPRFIKDEFDAFLECGIPPTFSGGCNMANAGTTSCLPSAASAAVSARHAAGGACRRPPPTWWDTSWTHRPESGGAHQWVLSQPITLRLPLAVQPELVTPVLQLVQRVVTRHLPDGTQLVVDEGHGGALALMQRSGLTAILERPVIRKSLDHLRLDPQPPPEGTAREPGPHHAG